MAPHSSSAAGSRPSRAASSEEDPWTSRAFVHLPGAGRPIDLGGFGMVVKATTEETDGAFSLLEASEPAGFGPPLHIHEDCAEAFYILAGKYHVFVEDETFHGPEGSFIFVPAGLRHGFRVGDVASRKLNLYTPGAMVGYFDDLSAAIAADAATPEAVDAIGRRHAMRVVGPIPDGYV